MRVVAGPLQPAGVPVAALASVVFCFMYQAMPPPAARTTTAPVATRPVGKPEPRWLFGRRGLGFCEAAYERCRPETLGQSLSSVNVRQ